MCQNSQMKRIYEAVLQEHFANFEQMVFLSGPRQVGKTTIEKQFAENNKFCKYLNWDIVSNRESILQGNEQIVADLPLEVALPQKPLIIFDEIHKFKKWRNLLKGFIDEYKGKLNIIVTGSAKLNLMRRSNESLMGKYFLYRVHPLSVGELCRDVFPNTLIAEPKKLDEEAFLGLCKFGGFPESFIKQNESFFFRWQKLRREQMIREDIATLAHIQELSQLEVLALLLREQTGQLTNFSQLGKKIQITDNTVRRWIGVLEAFYYCFIIRPWVKNVSRSLLKMPKVYLWDWSVIENEGARIENLVACHLHKAANFWTDTGLGEFELFFLRDKEQNEVDFLITQNKKPWLLVEVKSSYKEELNKNLKIFQKNLNVPHAVQLAYNLSYSNYDCFELKNTKIVSLRTFLSQLP